MGCCKNAGAKQFATFPPYLFSAPRLCRCTLVLDHTEALVRWGSITFPSFLPMLYCRQHLTLQRNERVHAGKEMCGIMPVKAGY